MRLQQYRFTPKLSKTSLAFSPVRMRRANSSHLSPTSLPQVKHLTGIIMLSSSLPVTLLLFSSCAWTAKLLAFLGSCVACNHGSVVLREHRSQVTALSPLQQRVSNCHACRFSLPHVAAADGFDIHIQLLPSGFASLQ